MTAVTKHERLIQAVRNKQLYSEDFDLGNALHSVVNTLFPTTADYGRAELCERLAKDWDRYPYGSQRKIYVRNVLNSWRHWYANSTTPGPKNKETNNG